MKLSIDSIKIGKRFRKQMGDIKSLAASMDKLGLLHPVVVTPKKELVAGERRMEAARLLKWAEIDAVEVDIESIVDGEYAENEVRKDFTASERVAIGKAIEKVLGNRRGSNQHTQKEDVQNFAHPPNGVKSRDVAAEKAGFGNPETYRQAKKVVDSGDEELVEKMDAGEVSISAAAKVVDKKKAETNGHAPKPEAEPKVETDPLGLPITGKMLDVFAEREKWNQARALMKQLAQLLNEMATGPAGRKLKADMHLEGTDAKSSWKHQLLQDLLAKINYAEPYSSVCAWCYRDHDGKPSRECGGCRGTNWVVKKDWDQVGEDVRDQLLKERKQGA